MADNYLSNEYVHSRNGRGDYTSREHLNVDPDDALKLVNSRKAYRSTGVIDWLATDKWRIDGMNCLPSFEGVNYRFNRSTHKVEIVENGETFRRKVKVTSKKGWRKLNFTKSSQ